jgi:carbonic anhydrase
MQLVWDKFPAEEEKEMQGGPIDLSGLFPANLDYYNYIGSLTTPPCSMGLQWILMKTPLMLSANQIEDFRSKYDHNYRPVQPLNNRLVFEKI